MQNHDKGQPGQWRLSDDVLEALAKLSYSYPKPARVSCLARLPTTSGGTCTHHNQPRPRHTPQPKHNAHWRKACS